MRPAKEFRAAREAYFCLFLLMNNFFIFNRFHSMSKKLCGACLLSGN